MTDVAHMPNVQGGVALGIGSDAPVPDLAQTLEHVQNFSRESDDHHDAIKQCHDLAFATAILRAGFTNARALALATKSWTTHGKVSLAEHLIQSRIISYEQRINAERRAEKRLSTLVKALSADKGSGFGGTGDVSQSVLERQLISRLDPTGKVAKLLGIADTSVLADDKIEDRQVDSRYTLLRKLGQGGLGIVWLARDQNLQRYVAVKEISREIAPGDPSADYFRREAEITGRLEHPGIVPVYQYGEDKATGKSFYVMRFLGKKTLMDAIVEYHERREAGNVDRMILHRLLTALVNVCHSVSHAHSRKVIHRDLKPENIALDEFGQVTLLDWGLAKVNDETGMYEVNGRAEPGDLHSVGSTHVGRVIGTPLYMAPEQAAGRLDEVDELTDVFALGGILYAILTGIGPHQTTIEEATSTNSRSDVMSMIVAGSVSPPSDVVASTPPELQAICMKALSAKRYLRYESASEFADDIHRFIAGTPVKAHTPSFRQRINRWMSTHPTLAQSVLLGTSLLLVGGAAIVYTARKGHEALRDARYTSIQDFTRKLEVSMNFEAQSLTRNLHFVSELPLMESIVDSQSTHQNADGVANQPDSNAAAINTPNGQTEDLDRQGNLFDGLLKANPAYLVAATCQRNADGSTSELVRSERLAAGRTVHRVPKTQLSSSRSQERESADARILESLHPDEVVLITNDQLSEDIPVATRSPLVLSGIRAVFDRDGDLFGLNIIELDLRCRLKEICNAVAPERATVYVADQIGNGVFKYADGQFISLSDFPLEDTFPKLKGFFDQESEVSEFGDGHTLYANRVSFGDAGTKAHIFTVIKIHD